jgi:DHA2 family multidrug resistance protein-like MFS transporter
MTATTRRTADVPERAGARQWAALVVLMLPVLLVSVDNTVLSFALPESTRSSSPASSWRWARSATASVGGGSC